MLDALNALEPPLQVRPAAADALASGRLPAGTQAVLGWSREQLPAHWPASATYLQVPQVIVRRRDATPILDLGGLRGQSVASPDPAPLSRLLEGQAPGALLLPPMPLDRALHLLVASQVDAVVANLVDVDRLLRTDHGDTLQVAAPAGFSDALVLATTPACRHWLALPTRLWPRCPSRPSPRRTTPVTPWPKHRRRRGCAGCRRRCWSCSGWACCMPSATGACTAKHSAGAACSNACTRSARACRRWCTGPGAAAAANTACLTSPATCTRCSA